MKISLGAQTLALPTPVWVIGTFDADQQANFTTIAWGGICCSKPPCVAVALREVTKAYQNIRLQKAFTVNIPSANFVREADYFGLASGNKVDKITASGITMVPSEVVAAPYVDDFPVVLECELLHTLEIGLHTQFIGEIKDVKSETEAIGPSSYPEMELVQPILFTPGARSYHRPGELIGKAFDIGKELL